MDCIIRRMRTRLPTCLSIGLGAFLAITISYESAVPRNVPHIWTQTQCVALRVRVAGEENFYFGSRSGDARRKAHKIRLCRSLRPRDAYCSLCLEGPASNACNVWQVCG